MIGRIRTEADLAAFIREQSSPDVLIRQLQTMLAALSGKRIAMGAVSCPNGDTTVTHGLGAIPLVWLQPFYGGGATAFNLVVKTKSATSFVVSNGSAATTTVDWLAIG